MNQPGLLGLGVFGCFRRVTLGAALGHERAQQGDTRTAARSSQTHDTIALIVLLVAACVAHMAPERGHNSIHKYTTLHRVRSFGLVGVTCPVATWFSLVFKSVFTPGQLVWAGRCHLPGG